MLLTLLAFKMLALPAHGGSDAARTDVSCPQDRSTWSTERIVASTVQRVAGGARVETCLDGLEANGRRVLAGAGDVCVVPVGGLVELRAVVGDPSGSAGLSGEHRRPRS